MSIIDLNNNDRVFTQLDHDQELSSSLSRAEAHNAVCDGLLARAQAPEQFLFVKEVPYQARKAEEFILKPGDGPDAFRAWLVEQSIIQTEWGPIQVKPYGIGYWVPVEQLSQAVVEQVIAKLLRDVARIDRFAINEAFRRHCPEPLCYVDIRDAVNQLRSKGQSVTHIIVANGVEVPDDLNLIVHRFPVADGFVLSGATEAPVLLTRDSGFEFLSNLTQLDTHRASFAIERRVGVSIIGPLHLCRIAPA